jgi:hypothetical protein
MHAILLTLIHRVFDGGRTAEVCSLMFEVKFLLVDGWQFVQNCDDLARSGQVQLLRLTMDLTA